MDLGAEKRPSSLNYDHGEERLSVNTPITEMEHQLEWTALGHDLCAPPQWQANRTEIDKILPEQCAGER